MEDRVSRPVWSLAYMRLRSPEIGYLHDNIYSTHPLLNTRLYKAQGILFYSILKARPRQYYVYLVLSACKCLSFISKWYSVDSLSPDYLIYCRVPARWGLQQTTQAPGSVCRSPYFVPHIISWRPLQLETWTYCGILPGKLSTISATFYWCGHFLLGV